LASDTLSVVAARVVSSNISRVEHRGGIMFEGIMQPMHLLVILIIALLFFGPSKLAGLGKGLGDGIRQFKDAVKEDAPKQ
jgi:sec-independent protein translocase protein TatA